jgi:hypothetical protein
LEDRIEHFVGESLFYLSQVRMLEVFEQCYIGEGFDRGALAFVRVSLVSASL